MFWTPQQVPILVVIVYRWDESGSEPRLVKDLVYVITQDSKHHARVGPSFWQCSNLQNRRPHVCGHNQPLFTTSLQHTQEHQQTRTQRRRSCNLHNIRPHVCFTVSHYSQPECALVTRQVVNSARQKMLTEYWDKVAGKRPEHVYEFVDGCASQFKGAPSFADIADSKTELGYYCTRYFHEVSHAKGPQDAAGANIKQAVKKAVLNSNGKWFNKVTDDESFYNCCVDIFKEKSFACPSDEVCAMVLGISPCPWALLRVTQRFNLLANPSQSHPENLLTGCHCT